MANEEREISREADAVARAKRQAPLTWRIYEWALVVCIGNSAGQCPEAHRATVEGLVLCLGECAHRGVRLAPGQERDLRRKITALITPWGDCEPPCTWCGARCEESDYIAYVSDGIKAQLCSYGCLSLYVANP